jgi:L-asparagine transporter-like permease
VYAATPTGSGFSPIVQRERGLQKTLSAAKLSMIAIGGAIGTGLFLGSGFAIGTAGPGVLISYAIGALIGLLLMGCLAEMTIAHPTTGSFGAYIVGFSGALIVVNAFSVSAFGSVGYWFSLIKITAIVASIVLAAYMISASSDSAVG